MPYRKMVPRPERWLHRKLHHRHVRFRIHIEQGRPGAVVEPAAAVDGGGEAFVSKQGLRALRERRRTFCGVLQAVERLEGTGESVGSPRLWATVETRHIRLPMHEA